MLAPSPPRALCAQPRLQSLPSIASRVALSFCLYAAALLWYSGAGQTHARRAVVVIAALSATAELVLFAGLRVAALPVFVTICTAIGASVGAATPFWELVLFLSVLLWLLVRWSPVCCGPRAAACCCTCALRKCEMRVSALPDVLMRLCCACAAVLLLPALAAQLDALSCLPASAVATGSRVYAFNRWLATVDNGGTPAEPPAGARPLLLRSSRDANESYAAWVSASGSRELFFAGTHSARMLALDLTVTPRMLHFENGSSCGDVIVHSGFYEVYADVRAEVHGAVRAALAENATAPVFLGGFSLGAAVAPIAALDLVCSGVASPTQLILFYMAGPGICSGDACAGAFDALQAAGLSVTRVVNVFDFISWLPAFLYEPLRTPAGRTLLTFTSTGQLLLTAHQGVGYIPAPSGCAGLRALAWVPFIVSVALARAFAAARPRGAEAQVRGGGAALVINDSAEQSADGTKDVAGGGTIIAAPRVAGDDI